MIPRIALLGTLAGAMALGLSGPSSASAGTLDQLQTANNGGRSAIDNGQSLAQTFAAGLSGSLDQVDLYLSAQDGAPTSYLSVEIRDVSAGAPGATILATRNVPASSVGVTGAFVPISFNPRAPVAAGTQYAIVAYSSTAVANSYSWFESLNDSYAGGSLFLSFATPPSSPWFIGAQDFAFKTYVVPSPPTAPLGPTGQRAAALAKCKKKAKKKDWSKKQLKKCKKKANLLPV